MRFSEETGKSEVLSSISDSSQRNLPSEKPFFSPKKRNQDPNLSPMARRSTYASENDPPAIITDPIIQKSSYTGGDKVLNPNEDELRRSAALSEPVFSDSPRKPKPNHVVETNPPRNFNDEAFPQEMRHSDQEKEQNPREGELRFSAALPELTLSDSPTIVANRKSFSATAHLKSIASADRTNTLVASNRNVLEIRQIASNRSSASFSFQHLELNSIPEGEIDSAKISSANSLCSCENAVVEKRLVTLKKLESICKEQADRIEHLQKQVDEASDVTEYERLCDDKEALLKEIKRSRALLPAQAEIKQFDDLRSSLLARSIQLRESVEAKPKTAATLDLEEMESNWVSFADGLRADIEASRQRAEEIKAQLKSEKKRNEEVEDALRRASFSHAKMVEHYVELQERHEGMLGTHRAVMGGVAEIKKATAKAGNLSGDRFAKAVAGELSTRRMWKEKETKYLKRENAKLKTQIQDTAETVVAAGELLERLKETERTLSVTEESYNTIEEENGEMKDEMEKLKKAHKMEMEAMKQYTSGGKLTVSDLGDEEEEKTGNLSYDDEAWRVAFKEQL